MRRNNQSVWSPCDRQGHGSIPLGCGRQNPTAVSVVQACRGSLRTGCSLAPVLIPLPGMYYSVDIPRVNVHAKLKPIDEPPNDELGQLYGFGQAGVPASTVSQVHQTDVPYPSTAQLPGRNKIAPMAADERRALYGEETSQDKSVRPGIAVTR